jgi:hypothetical protein
MYGVLQPNIPFNCHLKVEGYVISWHTAHCGFFFLLVPADDLARSYLVPAALAQRFSVLSPCFSHSLFYFLTLVPCATNIIIILYNYYFIDIIQGGTDSTSWHPVLIISFTYFFFRIHLGAQQGTCILHRPNASDTEPTHEVRLSEETKNK